MRDFFRVLLKTAIIFFAMIGGIGLFLGTIFVLSSINPIISLGFILISMFVVVFFLVWTERD